MALEYFTFNSSAQLKIKDTAVLDYAKELIITGKFRIIDGDDLSSFLFAFGMHKYNDQGKVSCSKCLL